jgi:hypothetical protein
MITTHARYKFIGTRSDDFSVIINAGVAGSWDRVVSNTTNRTATIRANPSDPSIPIPSNNAYRLLDVSFCVVSSVIISIQSSYKYPFFSNRKFKMMKWRMLTRPWMVGV